MLALVQVVKACSLAKTYQHNQGRGDWGCNRSEILGVHPEELERVRCGFKEQLVRFVGLLPSATKVDLRFLLFRLEASV